MSTPNIAPQGFRPKLVVQRVVDEKVSTPPYKECFVLPLNRCGTNARPKPSHSPQRRKQRPRCFTSIRGLALIPCVTPPEPRSTILSALARTPHSGVARTDFSWHGNTGKPIILSRPKGLMFCEGHAAYHTAECTAETTTGPWYCPLWLRPVVTT